MFFNFVYIVHTCVCGLCKISPMKIVSGELTYAIVNFLKKQVKTVRFFKGNSV